MDIIFIIIVAIVFIAGSVNKQKKQEQARRDAQARTMQPPPADPRFPPVASPMQPEMRVPAFSGEVAPGSEGEPVNELPVRPAPAVQRPQAYEGGNTQAEGGPAAMGSVTMPTAMVASHIEATQGRRAMLERGANTHAHTEGSMEFRRAPGHRAAPAQETQPNERGAMVHAVVARLGHDPAAVAEGVILSEILGKPKALRRV